MVAKQRMKAVYDCTADEPGEISFKEGDILVDVEDSNEEGWYIGRIENTNIKGLFPFNYVVPDTTETMKDDTPNKPAPKADTALNAFPTLDAFEAVMANTSKKPTSWTPLIPTSTHKPPAVASKPTNFVKKELSETIGLGIKPAASFEKPVLKPIVQDLSPSRARSFSASAMQTKDTSEQVLKPSQLKGTKSALEIALSKGSPRLPSNLRPTKQSSSGIALVGMNNTKSNDLDEDDGFQILKPSQLKQKQQQQQQQQQSSPSFKKPDTVVKSNNSSSSGLDTVASNNPMPRLPSRPTSTASRKSRTSRSSSTNVEDKKIEEKKEEKVAPPVLKPKPIVPSHPELPPRPKSRSTSNPLPPPIQPKPAMSSIEILLSRNHSTNEPAALKKTKPQVEPKPTIVKPHSAPGLPVRSHLNTKRSLEETKPPVVRTRSSTNPTDFMPLMEEPKKKAAPPPPPPSRPPKSKRYEVLFNSIHDDGFVDGETAHFIWTKSKLSNEDLARIWRECDPEHKGLLDKTAFIDGMMKIDDILSMKQQAI